MDNLLNYKLIGFRKSKRKNKKYDAILENKQTGKNKYVSFGQLPYEHYEDKTGLDIYKHLNHYDKNRRRLYRIRAGSNDYQKVVFSPAYFSWNYLW